ncbi:MAG TPA: thioesterase family protein [Mycobacteriales bacterium]|nr:thioesterase family protein [Mycobacteriales bacterium]
MASDAFFVQLADDRFRATRHTEGPWNEGAQHGGPPAALLGRAIEAASGQPDWVTARVAVDILGPIPVAELTVRAEIVRPGRSVELIEAELSAGDRVAARARGWRIRTIADPAAASDVQAAPALPAESHSVPWPGGYIAAVEWRFAEGGFDQLGAATVWTRARFPLVAGEPMSPLQRVLLVADSGNGASSALPLADFWFINPELTVHLYRLPETDWICLQARTTVSPQGVGLAESALYDRHGAIGRGAQALLVGPRPSATE